MSKQPIRILSNLARAGGTLISRCVGAMNDVVLLSEIHPLDNKYYNPLVQARSWYQLLRPEEIRGKRFDFVDAIRLIDQRCAERGKTLVIRDWAYLDFIGVPFTPYPPRRPLLNEFLSKEFDIVQYALVRHPVDQWLSTARLDIMKGRLELDTFLAGYRQFAEQCTRSGFTRYEDFTREPAQEMRRLCTHLQLDFDAGFIDRWPDNRHVTGDMSGTSRGSRLREIRPLPQRAVEAALLDRFRDNPDYRRAIALLGYTDPVAGS